MNIIFGSLLVAERRFGLFLGALFAFGLLVATAQAQTQSQSFETKAPYALVLDAQTGTVLLDKQAGVRMAPSSMSKLMTAYMVFERLQEGSLSLEDTFPVSENAWRKGGTTSGGSTMFLDVNSTVSVENLLRGIIIQSGNDACIVVAEGLAGDEDAFARAMNRKAKEIGLMDSNFVNATGLPDPDHYMTAHDLAILAQRIIERFPTYYRFYGETEFTYNGIVQHNRNPLLYRNVGADGLKTGHTSVAGYGLTASAKQGDRRIVMVINGLASIKERTEESERLIGWAFRNFENVKMYDAGTPISEAEVWMGENKTVPLVSEKPLHITLPRNASREMTVKVVYQGPLTPPIAKGTQVAEMILESPEMVTLTFPLVAGEDVGKLGWFGRFFRILGHMMGGLVSGVFSDRDTASSPS